MIYSFYSRHPCLQGFPHSSYLKKNSTPSGGGFALFHTHTCSHFVGTNALLQLASGIVTDTGGGLYEDDADGRNALMAWAADCPPSVCLAMYIGDEASLHPFARFGTTCGDDGTWIGLWTVPCGGGSTCGRWWCGWYCCGSVVAYCVYWIYCCWGCCGA